MKRCRCLSFSRSAKQRKQARPSAFRRGPRMICAKCGGVRNLYCRVFKAEPEVVRRRKRDQAQRLQGERQFVRRLRARLIMMRFKLSASYPKALKLGFYDALESVEAFLRRRNKR